MKFAVQWSGRALESLAQIWLENPTNRIAIRQATANTDQLLAFDPLDQGESREGQRRVLFVPPLVLTFHVDVVRSLILVLNVRYSKRRT